MHRSLIVEPACTPANSLPNLHRVSLLTERSGLGQPGERISLSAKTACACFVGRGFEGKVLGKQLLYRHNYLDLAQ